MMPGNVFLTSSFFPYRNFSAILWPEDKIFQTNIQIKIVSNRTEDVRSLSENLIYEGKLEGK